MRTIVRLSMALVALAAAALSYQSLMALAELAGYGRLSLLYPLVVDAGAAASCAAWLHTRGRQALVMTWCLLAVSVVLNGTTHYLESTHTAPAWLLVVAVAAVPPTVLGLCVHLAVDMGRPGQPVREEGVAGPTITTLNVTGDAGEVSKATDTGRPDQQVGGVRGLAGSTARGRGAQPGLTDATPTDDPRHTTSLDMTGGPNMDRPGQNGCAPEQAGSTTPPDGPREWFGPTPPIEAQTAQDMGRPDRTSDHEPAGPITRRVEASDLQDTDARNPLSELIQAGAGRRKIAAELDISEHAARKLLAERRNGDGSR